MTRLLTLLLTALSFYSYAAPKAELWPYWQQSDESSTLSISHQVWQELLDRYLVKEGEFTLFTYQQVKPADRKKLNSYLRMLSSIDPLRYSKAEQYAYWVNLYNAMTVELILDSYPVSSITKLGGLFSFGPWDEEITKINGHPLTLNDIEHRILRPIWNDPRTHYAVNCASLGCPNLQQQAFTAENSEALLQKAAREFINSSKGAQKSNGTLVLSSIYEWFSEDFGDRQQLLEHLGAYRTELQHYDGKIDYDYDWQLNENK